MSFLVVALVGGIGAGGGDIACLSVGIVVCSAPSTLV